jgi:hypothetical protein
MKAEQSTTPSSRILFVKAASENRLGASLSIQHRTSNNRTINGEQVATSYAGHLFGIEHDPSTRQSAVNFLESIMFKCASWPAGTASADIRWGSPSLFITACTSARRTACPAKGNSYRSDYHCYEWRPTRRSASPGRVTDPRWRARATRGEIGRAINHVCKTGFRASVPARIRSSTTSDRRWLRSRNNRPVSSRCPARPNQ